MVNQLSIYLQLIIIWNAQQLRSSLTLTLRWICGRKQIDGWMFTN